MSLNSDDLRNDLMDYYGSAMASGMPMAVIELSKVSSASDDELEDLARRAGISLSNYEDEDE